MSSTLTRLSTVGAAGGAALVLFAGPALASPGRLDHGLGNGTDAPRASAAATVTDESAGPPTTGSAAASVGFRISNARCFSNDVCSTRNTYETGFSGVQRLQQRAQLQKFTTRGWVNATGVNVASSTRFPNDGRSFSFSRRGTAATRRPAAPGG